jgi:hypothetical protein
MGDIKTDKMRLSSDIAPLLSCTGSGFVHATSPSLIPSAPCTNFTL